MGLLPLWLSWSRIRLQCGRPGFNPWVGKIPWRRERLPTSVFWPEQFHGLYSLWVELSGWVKEYVSGLPWWLSWSRIRLQCGRPGFDPWVGKIPWGREWLLTVVFSPGELHGQRIWWATQSMGVSKSWTWLKDNTFYFLLQVVGLSLSAL